MIGMNNIFMYPNKHEKEKSLDHFNDYYPIKKRDNVIYCFS